METLSKDLILYLALKLDLKSLKNFCLVSKKFNVSRNEIFWRKKLDIERPNLLSLISSQEYLSQEYLSQEYLSQEYLSQEYLSFKNYRYLYILLERTKKSYNIFYDYSNFQIFGVIRGKLTDINYHKMEFIESVSLGSEAWVCFIKGEEYYYSPKLFKTEKDAMKYAKETISWIYMLEEYDDGKMSQVLEKFEKDKYVKLYREIITIKKVTII